jgi:hypothetical protein
MIAPLRPLDPWNEPLARQLREARQAIARTFLPASHQGPPLAGVTPWRAWCFAAWAAIVAAASLACALGFAP